MRRRRRKKRARDPSKSSGRLERVESPRGLAASIVRGVLGGRGAARTHLERAFERRKLTGRDQALLTELVYGTIRHVGTLDHLLAACATKGLGRVEEGILAHLRVAAYQLLFCEQIAAGVAVNEAVAAAGRRSHVRGFVNGVLRNLERRCAGASDDGAPSRSQLPGRGRTWLRLEGELLPDPATDPGAWLAAAASLPRKLASDWVERLGLEQALAVARAQNAPPPLTLRVNALRGTREELLADLAEAGVEASPTDAPGGVVVRGGLGEGGADPLFAGRATVQDATAMRVAPLLAPQPGERVIDLCAAPGGKTTHLAELMRDEGVIDACDVDQGRLDRVRKAVNRLGLTSVRCHLVDPDDPRPPADPDGRPADRVLADVPCSNTGVLRRRVEVRWRLGELDRVELGRLQARLFDRAVELTRPGGRLVYATCSIEPAENQELVAAGLERHTGLRLVEELVALPELDGGDGGYAALLERP